MNREKNIFYNVIKNETSLTEIFCNLMYNRHWAYICRANHRARSEERRVGKECVSTF